MSDPGSSTPRFLVVGGGCYGAHYAEALARAMDKGECREREVWVIDRDPECAAKRLPPRPDRHLVVEEWDEFLNRHLGSWREGPAPQERDCLVPAPLTPHLFAAWIQSQLAPDAEVEEIAPPFLPATPFSRATGPRLVVSFAEWRCPTHCVEPLVCPATRQIKSWDVSRELSAYVRRLREAGWAPIVEPLVARVTHRAEGVGGFPLGDWTRAARTLRGALFGRKGRRRIHALAATVSSCHGAASLLRLTRRAKAGDEPDLGASVRKGSRPTNPG